MSHPPDSRPSRDRARSDPSSERAAARRAVSPVRGGTLPWGELGPELEELSAVPWPARSDELPPASAVRGGTLRWLTHLDEDDARDAAPVAEADAAPTHITLTDLLVASLPRDAQLREADGAAPDAQAEGHDDIASAIETAIESVRGRRPD